MILTMRESGSLEHCGLESPKVQAYVLLRVGRWRSLRLKSLHHDHEGHVMYRRCGIMPYEGELGDHLFPVAVDGRHWHLAVALLACVRGRG